MLDRWRPWLSWVLFVGAYYGLARGALWFVFAPDGVAGVWPLSGLALAALLLCRPSAWWGYVATVVVVNALANLSGGNSLSTSLEFAVANALEGALCAWTIRRIAGPEVAFSRLRDVLALAVAAVVPNGMTALVGAAAPGLTMDGRFLAAWFTWWVADGLGMLLVTPLIVTWATAGHGLHSTARRRLAEAAALVLLLLLAGWAIFASEQDPGAIAQRAYVILPVLLWAALRFPQRGVATALAILAALAIGGMAAANGPFSPGGDEFRRSLLATQLYLATISLSLLVIAALWQERTASETRLRRSEGLLRQAQQVARVGSWVWHVQGNRLEWSDEMYRIFGVARESFSGSLTDVVAQSIHPDDQAAVARSNEAVSQEGRPAPLEYRVVHPDGTVRVVWGEAGALQRDETGTPALLTGIVQDITERRQAEKQLRLLKEAVEAHSDGAYWLDSQNRLVYINRAGAAAVGYTPEELLGRPLERIDPRATPRAMDLVWRRLRRRGSIALETRHCRRDGSTFPVEVLATYVKADGAEYACGFSRDITGRQRAETELRESERFARSTVDALAAHVAILDEDGTIIAVNRAWNEFAAANRGDPAAVSAGANYLAVCDAASGPEAATAAEFAAGMRAVLAGHTPEYSQEYACPAPGEPRWFVGSVTLFPGDGPRRLVVAHENVTARRQAEEALRERERRLSTLISNLPGVAYRCRPDAARTMEHLAGSVRDLTGYGPDDLLGNRTVVFADLAAAEWRASVGSAWREAVAERHPFELEYPITTASNETRWVWERGRGVFSDTGELINLEGYILDVTERHRSADALRESQEQFAKVFYRSPALMSLSRLEDGRLLEVNDQFCAVSGFSREEAVGRTSTDLGWLSPAGREAALACLGPDGTARAVQLSLRAKDGRPVQCVCHGEVVAVGGERLLLSLALDVTEQQRVSAELEQQRVRAVHVDRLQALGEMATSIAHELNQPLNGIRAFAEGILLAPRMGWTPSTEETNQALTDIITQVDRVTDIVDHMRVFARGETGREASNFALGACVAGAMKLMGAQMRVRGIGVIDRSATAVPPCHGWPNSIEQVVLNLLTNARDALADRLERQRQGGPGVAAGWRPVVTISVGIGPENTVVLAVEDNAGGIDEQVLPRIFDPFFTTKEVGVGTGIGLPISRAIVERHQGRIEVDNRPGVGVTFRVVLPAAAVTTAPVTSA